MTISFRLLPSVDTLLHSTYGQSLVQQYGQQRCLELIRSTLDRVRQDLAGIVQPTTVPNAEEKQQYANQLLQQIEQVLVEQSRAQMRRVFNCSGVVLHTNIGRALLPENAIQAAAQAMRHPTTIEYDVVHGKRGDRDLAIEQLICKLTGAEAATIVNNNAAAVLLMLAALASQKEVLVSRGELVEIGGSFRIPDVMRQAGTTLKEVGTTNRTHPKDYEQTISAETVGLLKVHCSNYRIEGFTASVAVETMANIAHDHNVLCMVDAGSGTLLELDYLAHLKEPTIKTLIQQGADIVSFSGDKLLGGVQAGFLVGKKEVIAACKKHPLKRALRVDKITMAAMEAVLQLYQNPEALADVLPTHYFLNRTQQDIELQAQTLLKQLRVPKPLKMEVALMESQIGSGALPTETLPSAGWKITVPEKSKRSLVQIEKALRDFAIPCIGRVYQQAIWLDFRTLRSMEETEFIAQWQEFFQKF